MNVKLRDEESLPSGGIVTNVSGPRLLDLLGRAASASGFGEDWVALARKAGISERAIRRWREGTHDDPRLSSLESVAGALGITVGALLGETQTHPSDPDRKYDVFEAPLLRLDVAAGEPRLEVIPDGPRPYYFRREWLIRKGWNGDDRDDRFGVYRLGDRDIADSMFPTIQPGSVLLVDRRPNRATVPDRSIWIVRVEAGGADDPQAPLFGYAPETRLTTKRVTLVDHQLVLESDNHDPKHAPRLVRCRPNERAKILEGRVIWFATELE